MSLVEVRERITAAARRADRDPAEVTLVVVTKNRTTDEIRRLYDQGQREFGENRAQELREKVPELPEDIRWHFVGALQTNKVRIVRPVVVLLHSLDRPHLASAWMKGPGRPPPALVEVNLSGEPQRHGVAFEELDAAVDEFIALGVPVVGLMGIAPIVSEPERARPFFARLREARDRISRRHPQVVELSMGMTDDFEVAVEEGATYIRVGRAIFDA